RDNDDRDHVLRHAAVFALASIGATDVLHAHRADASTAVRRGALLALIRLQDPIVAAFFQDRDASLRQEAARGIYGEPIVSAMPAVVQDVNEYHADLEAIDRHALKVNRRLGADHNDEPYELGARAAPHPRK